MKTGRHRAPRRPNVATAFRSQSRLLGAGVAVALLASVGVGAASADPYPSQQQVDQAQAAADDKAGEVAQLESSLAQASDQLESAQIEAASAAEDYNEATVRLDAATTAAQQASTAAEQARTTQSQATTQVGNLAAQTYRNGGSLGVGIQTMLAPGGPQDLIDRADALNYVAQRNQLTLAAADSARNTSQLADAHAKVAEGERADAAAAASAASKRAGDLEASAQSLVQATAAQRNTTIAQLATLRRSSINLEAQRQAGIEAERQAAAEEAARQAIAAREAADRAKAQKNAEQQAASLKAAAERAAAQQAALDRAAARTPKTHLPTPTATAAKPATQPAPTSTAKPTASSPAKPTTAPVAQVSTGSSKGSSSAGQAAVDWARTQIGKPYRWGATGPNSYDCSGLTSQAWAKAGVKIPRVSRDQYRAAKKISYSEMRPGDLIFYGSGNNASSVHHVAIYSGNGKMIEAPRSGLNLREVPVRMKGAMTYAGRV